MRHLLPCLALLLASCSSSPDFMTRYHEDGRSKPSVVIASMIDTTSSDLPWSLTEELTQVVVGKMGSSGDIFVEWSDEFSPRESPFGSQLEWVKQEFPSHEFVVFLEMTGHELVPSLKDSKQGNPSSNLNMEVRLRVLDVRGSSPRVVLQESLRDSYFIPRGLLPVDYQTVSWGTEEFSKTPMGIAHAQLSDKIVERVSDYILLAKSR